MSDSILSGSVKFALALIASAVAESWVVVSTGYLIGRVGQSGDARGTAPHLHFGISWPTKPGIWWVRRGELNPFDYITAWRAGKDISPAKSVAVLKNKLGEIPKQVGY